MKTIMKAFLTVAAMAPSTARSFQAQAPQEANAQMQAVLDQLLVLGGKPIEQLTPQEARRQPTPADAVRALLIKRGRGSEPEPVARIEDKFIPGPGGDIEIRIYTPDGVGPFPVILYIHGGGWVIADLNVYDSSPRALANAAKAVVISTHYRLAPEYPFPASHEDTFAAYRWALDNAKTFNGNANRVAVVGESAGGNMAASICLMAREQSVPAPVYQVLIYPVVGTDEKTPSFQENANAKPLSKAMMEWFGKHEFQKRQDRQDPRIDLLNANLRGLPPATIITAQIDPLRSGGRMLADRLKAAGVKVVYKNYDGVTHEFFGMAAVLDESKEAIKLAAEDLLKAFKLAAN